jgi:hypothetical protein
MKALCVVAHPDDCVIFAWPFIDQFLDFDWTLLYVTYDEQEPRGEEISKFWKNHGIQTKFLGCIDTYQDMLNNKISFDTDCVFKEIQNYCSQSDLVLTHASDGDYGHIHHKFVHECVSESDVAKVWFSNHQEYNFKCVRKTVLDLDLLPLHKDVILQFEDISIGKYFVTESASGLLNVKINS